MDHKSREENGGAATDQHHAVCFSVPSVTTLLCGIQGCSKLFEGGRQGFMQVFFLEG